MLNAEDRYASLSQQPEFHGLLRDAKPVVLYDLTGNICLWCNAAAARHFADGGMDALLGKQVPSLSAALPALKTMAGRLVHEGQKTLARLRLGGTSLAGLATVSIKRTTLVTGERPLLIRFLDAPDQRIDDGALRRFFFGYDDVRDAIFPSGVFEAGASFLAAGRAGTAPAPARQPAAEETPAAEEDLPSTDLTPEEEGRFRAIADALGMKLANEADEAPGDAPHAETADDEATPGEPTGGEDAEPFATDAGVEDGAKDEAPSGTASPEDAGEEEEPVAPPEDVSSDATPARDDKRHLRIVPLDERKEQKEPGQPPHRQHPESNLIELFAHRQKRQAGADEAQLQDWQPVVVMKEGSVLEANQAALELFAVASQEELARSDAFAQFLAAFRAAHGGVFEIYNASGEALRLQASVKPVETDETRAEILFITQLERNGASGTLQPVSAAPQDTDQPQVDAGSEISEDAEDEAFLAAEPEELGGHPPCDLRPEDLVPASGEAGNAPSGLHGDDENVFYIEEDEDTDVTALREEVADLETTVEELERALDISRARERELRAVLGTATDGVLILDEHGRVISMNAGAEALLGRDENTVLGRHFTDLLTLESRSSARSYFEGVAGYSAVSLINDGREVNGLIDAKQGAIALFMSIGRLGDEQAARFCAVFRDITPWKKTEAELLEARRRAEQASQQKTEFLAKVSHEVRTPLNAIIGFSDVMLEERFGAIGNQRYRSYLQDIKQGGQYVISLVNDLLDLAKIESGRMEMAFEQTSLNDTVQSVQAMVQPQAASGRVIMRYSLGEGLPDVIADQRALKQVLINILSNAVKFTDAGGQVIVSTRREDDGGVAIRIRDTGEGMSADELALALKPFRQVGSRKKGGTGLGLPLSRALTEANRARFSIESEKGVGTTVSIFFPLQQVCKSS